MTGWLTLRGMINSGFFVGDLCLCIVLVRMLWLENKTPGWLGQLHVQAAIVLLVYFSGMSVMRGWSAVLLWTTERGGDTATIESAYPIAALGAVISYIGVLGCVRRFGSRRALFYVLAISIIVQIVAYNFAGVGF